MTFVDTSGWYSYFIPSDPDHVAAAAWIAANRSKLLTTDYVIDETLTLMRARRESQKSIQFGTQVFAGKLAIVHYLTVAEIDDAWDIFRHFADKDWSFTDCTSKVVIDVLGIASAFSFDQHFRQFGTVTVVP